MGSCCFTPKKTHFLWWYWLALASIVGIPMLIAASYVARHKANGDAELNEAGKRASRLFWWSAALSLVMVIVFGALLAITVAPEPPVGHFPARSLAADYAFTLYLLALDFACCFIAANVTVALLRRSRSRVDRFLVAFGGLGFWLLVSLFTYLANPLQLIMDFVMGGWAYTYLDSFRPMTASLEFAICLTMAWNWRGFLAEPLPRTARLALIAFIAGAGLFYLAARYGNPAHFYLYHLARGTVPDPAEAVPYMMK